MFGFVSPESLASELAAGRRLSLIETRWAQGVRPDDVLPGTIFLDTDALEDGRPTWRLRPVSDLAALLGAVGVASDRPAVVVSISAIAAARVGWTLAWLGVPEVRLLDGGAAAWRPFTGPTNPPTPSEFHPHVRDDLIATTGDLERGGLQIADARSLAEFRGETSGYSYLRARGRIPGAIWVGDADDHAGELVGPDGRFADPGVVVARWAARGLDLATPAVFTCGGGWRAALAWFFAVAAGLPSPRCHPGGWSEWAATYDSQAQEHPTPRPTERDWAGPQPPRFR